jgi:hypothetical protein
MWQRAQQAIRRKLQDHDKQGLAACRQRLMQAAPPGSWQWVHAAKWAKTCGAWFISSAHEKVEV